MQAGADDGRLRGNQGAFIGRSGTVPAAASGDRATDQLVTAGEGYPPPRCATATAGSSRSSDAERSRSRCAVTYSVTAALVWPGGLAQVGLCRARARRTASSMMCSATSANVRCSAWLIARSWVNASSALHPVRPRMTPIA